MKIPGNFSRFLQKPRILNHQGERRNINHIANKFHNIMLVYDDNKKTIINLNHIQFLVQDFIFIFPLAHSQNAWVFSSFVLLSNGRILIKFNLVFFLWFNSIALWIVSLADNANWQISSEIIQMRLDWAWGEIKSHEVFVKLHSEMLQEICPQKPEALKMFACHRKFTASFLLQKLSGISYAILDLFSTKMIFRAGK